MDRAYTVPPGSRRLRADKALAGAFPEYSRSAIQRAFAAGRVSRNGEPLGQDQSVAGGDRITFSLPEPRPSALIPLAIPLDVLYEDRHLLAVNKPPGMVVHPGAGTGGATLVHALLAHCAGTLSGIGGVERPGIVHRLDRETSGIVMVAKTDAAHRGLSEQFARRAVQKEYLALVEGVPELLSGSIRKRIGRHPRARRKMAAFGEQEASGRHAHTDWKVVERFGGKAALLRCTIHTGRTHQIRVHLKAIGHPVLGDALYGRAGGTGLPLKPARVMLHAERLAISHPITGKPLDLHAPVPEDMRAVLSALKGLSLR
jgi:23S rRNA pseudouridine1911/1915/1917 synthase